MPHLGLKNSKITPGEKERKKVTLSYFYTNLIRIKQSWGKEEGVTTIVEILAQTSFNFFPFSYFKKTVKLDGNMGGFNLSRISII